MHRAKITTIVLLLLSMSGLGGIQAEEESFLSYHSSPNWSPDGMQIAFEGIACAGESGPCNSEIYLMDTDGSNLINVTQSPDTNEYTPRWSPDSQHIAYLVRSEDGIFVMNRDGSDSVRVGSFPIGLLDHPSTSYVFDWSPDGQQLVFVSTQDESLHLFRVDSDGSNLVQLTKDAADHLSSAWSPDGHLIAFVYTQGSLSDIAVIAADGTHMTNLTNTASDSEILPAWSPDGAQIMFTMTDSSAPYALAVMNADGTERIVLEDHLGAVYPPRVHWSPDGTQVAFSLVTGMMSHIAIMSADSSSTLWLTENLDTRNGGVSWSPDGTKLAFHSAYDGDYNIYTIHSDGTNLVQLTSVR